MKKALLAAALLLAADEARAEIAVLTNGMTLKVTGRRVEGETAFLALKGGGEMGVPVSLIRGVVPDEVIDEIVPGAGGDLPGHTSTSCSPRRRANASPGRSRVTRQRARSF